MKIKEVLFLSLVAGVFGYLWWVQVRRNQIGGPKLSAPQVELQVETQRQVSVSPGSALRNESEHVNFEYPPTKDKQIPLKPDIPHNNQIPDSNPFKEKSSLITYDIYNDWAIAYGDVLLGKVEGAGELKRAQHRPEKPLLWDSNVIPYAIHKDLKDPDRVMKAINYFNENTVIRFVPIQIKDEDAVVFIPHDTHCASYIGRTGGKQPIMVADKCGRQELIHELMHALGFVHEHSRPDRTHYLEVVWNNIDPLYWPQFAEVPDSLIHEYRGSVFDFDPLSAMLYPSTAFAKVPGDTTLKPIGQVQLAPTLIGLSAVDRERLFFLYGN
jgi:hypothetical protein